MTQASEYRQGVLQDAPGETALRRLAELAAQFGAEHIASTALSTAERVSEGRFYVACVGQFKRGKSTLLNALIGHSVLPTAVVPVTAVPTIIRHGKQLAARVRFQGETWTDIAVSSVEEYVSEAKNPENAKGVAGRGNFRSKSATGDRDVLGRYAWSWVGICRKHSGDSGIHPPH